MKVRALITLLLTVALGATHAAAGARFAEREAPERPSAREERAAREQLTEAEAREAREFAEALFRRLEEEQDFAPLVGEMFVGDFAERLHASVGAAGSLYFLDRVAAAQATRDEVLRHHVACNNLILLSSLYVLDARLNARAEKRGAKSDDENVAGTTGQAQETKGAAEGGEAKAVEATGAQEEADLKLADIFPPEVLELFMADPLLGRFVLDEEAREVSPREDAAGGADEEEFITTVEQLRSFTSTIERANGLLRRRLTDEQKKRVFDEWRRAAERQDGGSMRPRATAAAREWYGQPAGTRIVCVGLLMFQFEMVRVGGGYKILAMYLNDD